MAWRKHADNHDDCWCQKTFPVHHQGAVVGKATPLEDGSYAIILTHDGFEGTLLEDLLKAGVYNQFSIQEPIQDVLFETEEDENDD
ncbi:hypothetical protein SEA_ZEINA_64 [Arthrobacter phage Zeina]|nr:hypothetical protein SEA_ZEINA_64 [Arthrobacter phage Zeina]